MTEHKTICDRCGKGIPERKYPVMYVRSKKFVTKIFGFGPFDYMDKNYDFCKECTEAFEKFMEEGKSDDRTM